MRKHTQLQSFAFIIIMLSFASCQDDDEGVLFPNGSRELVIEFQEFDGNSSNFCYVTDESGRTWWDSVYMGNRSTRTILVPKDKEVNITFGRQSGGTTDHFWLETFRDVDDHFSEVGLAIAKCAPTLASIGFDQRYFIVEEVPNEIEFIQSGITRIDDVYYDSHLNKFYFSARFSTYGLDEKNFVFFALQENLSKTVKGFMLDYAMINTQDTILLNYETFENTIQHMVNLPSSGFWKYSLNGTSEDKTYVFKAREFISLPSGPSTNELEIYLPSTLNVAEFGMNVYEQFSTADEQKEVVYYGESIPARIFFNSTDLEDEGTNTTSFKFSLNNFASFTRAEFRYENSSAWSLYQVDGTVTDFDLPEVPRNITASFPDVVQIISSPVRFGVTSYVLEDSHNSDAIPMNSRRVIRNIRCLSHQNVTITKTLQ